MPQAPKPDFPPDSELLKRISAGDEDASRIVWKKYKEFEPTVYHLIFKKKASMDDAQTAVTLAMMRLIKDLQNGKKFLNDSEGCIGKLVTRAAVNWEYPKIRREDDRYWRGLQGDPKSPDKEKDNEEPKESTADADQAPGKTLETKDPELDSLYENSFPDDEKSPGEPHASADKPQKTEVTPLSAADVKDVKTDEPADSNELPPDEGDTSATTSKILLPENIPDDSLRQQQAIEEKIEEIKFCLQFLKPLCQAYIEAYFFENLSLEEMMVRFPKLTTTKSVSTTVTKCVQKLKKIIKQLSK